MVQITNGTTGIKFVLSSKQTRIVPHGQIQDVTKHWNTTYRAWFVVVNLTGASNTSADNYIRFPYDSVTIPTTLDVDDLMSVILYYNGSYSRSHVFTAIAGQTVFDCTPYFALSASTLVSVGGVLTFTGWSLVGNTVVFTIPMLGGEEVAVISL